MPTPSDLFLAPDLTEADARAYLQALGFRDVVAVDEHLQKIADDLVVREALGRLAPELIPALLETPDPDAAAIGVSLYVAARTGRAMLLDYLREDPRALHVLTYVMGASPVLSQTLVRTPEYFHWLVSQVERSAPDRQDHEDELMSALASVDDPAEALIVLRRWKKREWLRIGTRDLLRHETVQTVSAQLSDVASVAVDFALAIVTRERLDSALREGLPGAFAVIGTGRMGGREMAYASDAELLFVYEPDTPGQGDTATHDFFNDLGHDLVEALGDDSHEGMLYRVTPPEWRGTASPVGSLADYERSFIGSTDVSRRLSLTRARPIAGDADLAARFMDGCHRFVYGAGELGSTPLDLVRAGVDLEMFTQACQLMHGGEHAAMREAGTLEVLEAMRRAGLIPEPASRELDRAYVFQRSAEHRRQLGLQEDLQKQIDASRERVREICRGLVE